MLLFIYSKLRENGLEKMVVLDTEDTDVYVQAAYVAHRLPGLWIYKNCPEDQFINCEELCSAEMADVIIPLHVLTGCDSNSAFFGHGKKKIYDVVNSNEEAKDLLKSCGDSLDIQDSDISHLTSFVLKYIYNDKSSDDATTARVKKWKSYKKKKITSSITP